MEVLMAMAADEERLLLHYGLFEPRFFFLLNSASFLSNVLFRTLFPSSIASFLIQSIYLCSHFAQTRNYLTTL
jgi:hypothetical protein